MAYNAESPNPKEDLARNDNDRSNVQQDRQDILNWLSRRKKKLTDSGVSEKEAASLAEDYFVIEKVLSRNPAIHEDREQLKMWHRAVGITECDCELVIIPCQTPANLQKRIRVAERMDRKKLAARLRKKLARHAAKVAANGRCNCLVRTEPCKIHTGEGVSLKIYNAICLQLDPAVYGDPRPPRKVRSETIVGNKNVKVLVMADRAERGEGLRRDDDDCRISSLAIYDPEEDLIEQEGERLLNGNDHKVTTLKMSWERSSRHPNLICRACKGSVDHDAVIAAHAERVAAKIEIEAAEYYCENCQAARKRLMPTHSQRKIS